MKSSLLLLCILAGATCSGTREARAQVQVTEAYLKPDLQPGAIYIRPNAEGWKYHLGDDRAWAEPEYHDQNWMPLPAWQEAPWIRPEGVSWSGVGWFRLRLHLAPDFRNRTLGLVVYQTGASEIFLNGRQVFSRGKVGRDLETETAYTIFTDTPEIVPVRFENREEQVLAVRFSNFWPQAQMDEQFPNWWGASITDLSYYIQFRDNRIRRGTALQILSCVPMAFALLHFLFYLFYRQSASNLYYAIFAASIGVMIYVPLQMSYIHHAESFWWTWQLFKVAILLTVISSLRFYYAEFLGRLPRLCLVPLMAGCLMVVFAWIVPRNYVYIFALLSFPEALRVVLMGIKNRKPGAGIIGVGVAMFVLACTYQVLMELQVLEQDFSFVYVYGILALVISMSVYLAYTFALTNQELKKKVEEVKTLSDQNLAQEKVAREHAVRAREEETSRKLLETEIAMKEKELEEDRKRQQILKELEQSNQELTNTRSQLVQSEKMAALGNLVAGIAHEINTPVGAIHSMHDTLVRAIDRLKDGLEDPSNRLVASSLQVIGDANQVIATGTQRVTEIVKSLRNFARLDEAEMKEADVHEGIDSTLTLVHHHLKGRIEVVKRYGEIPPIVCYPSRLNQVFLNLLVNASQAIEGEGVIEIETGMEEERVYVSIMDSGRGISEAHLERIFDPGFTTKGVGVGTGLGLSICYQIVQDHEGEIRVESEVGQGTTFTVYLSRDLDKKT